MKKKHLARSFQLHQRVAAFFILGLLCGGTTESLRAHGSMLDPVSRVYRIFLDNPQTPQNDAARAAL